MGHGAARELAGPDGPLKEIPAELSAKLKAALEKMDKHDPEFASTREDERHQQTSKAWTARAGEIVEELRAVCKAMVSEHQILCDTGMEGAGVGIRPYVEDTSNRFDKLEYKLEGIEVQATCTGTVLATAPNMDAVDYDFLERATVEWLVWSVGQKVR